MPFTLRTASFRVIGARFELRSVSALLLTPGRALQRVRDSPDEAEDADVEIRPSHVPPFALRNAAREPSCRKDAAGRQSATNLGAAKIQRFVLFRKEPPAWRRCCSGGPRRGTVWENPILGGARDSPGGDVEPARGV